MNIGSHYQNNGHRRTNFGSVTCSEVTRHGSSSRVRAVVGVRHLLSCWLHDVKVNIGVVRVPVMAYPSQYNKADQAAHAAEAKGNPCGRMRRLECNATLSYQPSQMNMSSLQLSNLYFAAGSSFSGQQAPSLGNTPRHSAQSTTQESRIKTGHSISRNRPGMSVFVTVQVW